MFANQLKLFNYVKSSLLDSLVAADGWKCINSYNYVDKIKNRFKIFVREKELEQFPCITSGEFSKYPSLQTINKDGNTFVVACDSEWVTDSTDNTRFILSWQFSFIKDKNKLVEMIFVVANMDQGYKSRLDFKDALSVLYCYFDDNYDQAKVASKDVLKYEATAISSSGAEEIKVFKTKADAVAAGYSNINAKDYSNELKDRIDVCVIFHMGVVDISAFNHHERKQILKRLTSIQKGLVSLTPIKLSVKLLHNCYSSHKKIFPMSLTIRDTMCHSSPGHKSLAELGRSINYAKVSLDDEENWIEKMDELLMADPAKYFEYAATDATVTLLYSASLYGKGSIPRVTITAAAAGVMYNTIGNYLGIDMSYKNKKRAYQFDRKYRGLRTVKKGNVSTNGKTNVPYLKATELEPLSINAGFVQMMASKAYHGGYNGCSEVGFYDIPTHDYDLVQAYPTAMCLIPDVWWERPINQTIYDFDLVDIGDELFSDDSPAQFMLASVRSFKFPAEVTFPCIPVVVDGNPIYPREYNAEDESCEDVPSVVITGPELYLAWKLGADVHIDVAVILNTIYDNNGYSTFSLTEAVAVFAQDRIAAKAYAKKNGIKNYLPDTILKLMNNSEYGKVAQSVINKRTWNAFIEATEVMGCSIITNPVNACFITAYVRCVLIAAQNQCVDNGYRVFSVTTDGFISNVPEDILKGYELYGFRDLLGDARLLLTNNANGEIWEIKHNQNDLLNFSTRGNLSCSNLDGVLAHAGAKSPFLKAKECINRQPKCPNVDDSYCKTNGENCPYLKDREWLAEKVLTRTGKVPFDIQQWVSFKDLVLDEEDDFKIYNTTRNITMDFDFKREPQRNSFYTAKPVVHGIEYEIANFNTNPYQTVSKYKEYRQLAKWISNNREDNPSRALLTEYDWESNFWKEIDKRNKKAKASNTQNPKRAKVQTTPVTAGAPKKKIINYHTLTDAEKKVLKQIRGCLYAYKAGQLDIPAFADKSNAEIAEILNKSKITPHKFSSGDLKNYNKQDRWPWELTSGKKAFVNGFLKKLEPTLTEIVNI